MEHDQGVKAAIIVASRDVAAREVLEQELRKRYGADYHIVVCHHPAELGILVKKVLAAGTPVALVIGGVGAQDPEDIEVLAAIRAIDPTASRVAAVPAVPFAQEPGDRAVEVLVGALHGLHHPVINLAHGDGVEEGARGVELPPMDGGHA